MFSGVLEKMIQTEKHLDKLDTHESMVALLMKGKLKDGESDGITLTPVSQPSHSETSTPRILSLQVITEASQLGIKKIELPNFDGNDPINWLARADQYFLAHQTTANLKVQLTMICMEGPALHWFRRLTHRNPNMNCANKAVDALSRCGNEGECTLLSMPYWIDFDQLESEAFELLPYQNDKLQTLLQEYESVFAKATTFPPSRPIDHALPLQQGISLVSVRPYHYSNW
ncbi:hypothetical protein GH714_033880 [Hevea brasiliensis]|uniref:Retrotransposon gag domain-containing protein n=1 Tax=Hevea brasiliensis TaxID=3981 RepID=A0A6A6L814_HEVBR|nr:hypothetical protein GH714_033880 [Hevea brasiliensis]